MQSLVIVNGSARAAGEWAQDMERFAPCDVVITGSAAEARARIGALPQDCPRLIVVGGDGAVNLALDALGDRRVPVVVVPAGSANDLSRALDGAARAIDVLQVNGRRFCTVGGIGIPSTIALRANALRASSLGRRTAQRLGRHLYTGLAAQNLLLEHAATVRASVRYEGPDGAGVIEGADVDGVFVCNQGTVAGGLLLCSEARNDDGVFEICVVKAGGRRRRLHVFTRMLRGRRVDARDMRVVRATAATIHVDAPGWFFGDGEALVSSRVYEIEVRPRALMCSASPGGARARGGSPRRW